MKTWHETEVIFRRLGQLDLSRERAALGVIVRARGSTYRGAGARLLIEPDGRLLGNVSGGCLEQDLRRRAEQVVARGQPEMVHYETGTEEEVLWGMGMDCGGDMDVFLQPCPLPDHAAVVAKVNGGLAGDEPFALATVVADSPLAGHVVMAGVEGFAGGGTGDTGLDDGILARCAAALGTGKPELCTVGAAQVFVDVLRPPANLVICGAGDDSIPLAALAAETGFRVFVADHRSAYLTRERFPGAWALVAARAEDPAPELPAGASTYVVVKTRVTMYDEAWVRRFAPTVVPYIGLLGPRHRRDKVLAQLGEGQRARIYGPIGLDVGADGPEQIGLSIVAEILAVVAGRQPGHLRERDRRIHGC